MSWNSHTWLLLVLRRGIEDIKVVLIFLLHLLLLMVSGWLERLDKLLGPGLMDPGVSHQCCSCINNGLIVVWLLNWGSYRGRWGARGATRKWHWTRLLHYLGHWGECPLCGGGDRGDWGSWPCLVWGSWGGPHPWPSSMTQLLNLPDLFLELVPVCLQQLYVVLTLLVLLEKGLVLVPGLVQI